MRYYERELAYIRKALSGFAQRFPEQAEQLQLNKNSVEDPSITRLLDGMALLTARTELRLDEQLPDILAAADLTLEPEILARIDAVSTDIRYPMG